ncbi:MAG: radical SAM protein [Elusimicrobiota bacterium]
MNSSISGEMFRLSLENNIPLDTIVELTDDCNLSCLHCCKVKNQKADILSYEELTDLFNQLAKAGGLYLIFTGGEIFSRPDALKIIRLARQKGFALSLFTNGTLIERTEAEALARLSLQEVHISLYAAAPAVHEKITGVKGSFTRSLKAIKLLKERAVSVKIKSLLMTLNAGEQKKLKQLAGQLGVKIKFDFIVTPRDNGDRRPLAYRLPLPVIRKAFAQGKNFAGSSVGGSFSSDDFFCSAGKNLVTVTAAGKVLPCLQLPIEMGDLRRQSFAEIWSGSQELQNFRKIKLQDLPVCAKCSRYAVCQRCPGIAYLEDGDLFGPANLYCQISGKL